MTDHDREHGAIDTKLDTIGNDVAEIKDALTKNGILSQLAVLSWSQRIVWPMLLFVVYGFIRIALK